MNTVNEIIQYCQYEIKKAKVEYHAGDITLSDLQRRTRAINNIIEFAVMKRSAQKQKG